MNSFSTRLGRLHVRRHLSRFLLAPRMDERISERTMFNEEDRYKQVHFWLQVRSPQIKETLAFTMGVVGLEL